MDKNKWYIANGEQGDIFLSSRVRLARNIEKYPFPRRLSDEGARLAAQEVLNALSFYRGEKLRVIDMAELSPHTAISLAEKHLISPEFTEPKPGRILILSENEDISIMLCEEDHIRIQAMSAGYSTDGCYAAACSVDDCLDAHLKYAFDERLGYLTQSPAELGTAMRASFLMHMPALSGGSAISDIAATVAKLGFGLRPVYSEGGAAKGDIYILGNQLTLGISENTALDNLKSAALQLATKERAAREALLEDAGVRDRIQRAYGAMDSARMLTSDEMLELISLVRLGAVYGLLPLKVETVNSLLSDLLPATLNSAYGEGMDRATRDTLRAEIIRRRFAADDNDNGNLKMEN